MQPRDLAKQVWEWARSNGALAETRSPASSPIPLTSVWDGEAIEVQQTARGLKSAQVTGILVDDQNRRIVVLTKNALGPRKVRPFPYKIGDIAVDYIGHALVEPNPPTVPHMANLPTTPWFIHNGRVACGSSVTAAPIHAAGTLGCLVERGGVLYGLTNNHVTGDCNHTVIGMHILSPAPFDAAPSGPAPRAIGRHHSLEPLQSGDPRQVQLQDLDLALFEINDPALVSSMQGAYFDTPATHVDPSGGMRVKKVGRTTGITSGTVIGYYATPVAIPYKGTQFASTVYFRDVWGIEGENDSPFSEPGDSGSLVVTEDGTNAVGVIFAGSQNVSLMLPFSKVVQKGWTLKAGHGT